MKDRDKELLAELLLRWEGLYERGQDTPASELAKDHPELIEELARRISVLKRSSWLDKPITDDPPALDRPPSAALQSRTLANRYRLDELIAEGGFAQVFRAYDRELQRTVALKLPKPSRLESTEAFQAEARRVARLKHDSIVPVYDVGIEGNACFIVTEYIEGGSLADRLVTEKPTQQQAVRWVADIADALEHAHLHGIVHRDVKPANILIDHQGRALLADFGIAQSASKSGRFAPSLGTLRYMSPEQLEGKPTDHRSDIYSLAVVLYEALTGSIPYSSSEPNVLRKEIVEGKPATCTDDVAEGIKQACKKALSKSPHQRQASASQFASELRRAIEPARARFHWLWIAPALMFVGGFGAFAVFRPQQPTPVSPATPASLSFEELMAEGKNQFFQGNHEQAEAKLSEALRLSPGNLECLTKRGLSRTNRGAFKAGIEDYTTALRIKPEDALLHKYRAIAYVSLRDFEAAIADYTKTLELNPSDREAREGFGITYAIMASEKADAKEFQKAVDLMEKAIGIYPENPVFYHQRGSGFYHTGQFQKAIDDLNVAISREPNKPDHYENRALCLQSLGKNEEAEADFAKAKKLRNR